MLHVKFVPTSENVSLYYVNFFLSYSDDLKQLAWPIKMLCPRMRSYLNFEPVYFYSGDQPRGLVVRVSDY